ncbi:MAG: LamG-like jellyroll fold domain-containing protein [Terrimicrobiaceae bacterium]
MKIRFIALRANSFDIASTFVGTPAKAWRQPVLAGLCALFCAVGPANAQINQTMLDQIKTMTFNHEGALNTDAELQFIKAQIQKNAQPWSRNYERLGRAGSLTYTPHPVAHVSQGFSGDADVGGADLINDSIAAYAEALMWKFSGNNAYADKAVQILNAWSSILVDIRGPNWYLLAAWSGGIHPLAADIIRDYPGWAVADKARYKNMLNTIYLPLLNKRYSYGNREFAVCQALCAIGVFNEDRAAFYQGIHHWMSYFPCYVYMTADGPKPKVADYWVTEPTLDQYYAMHANIFPNRANSWIDKPNNPQPGVLGDDKTGMVGSYSTGDATSLWNGMNLSNGFYQGACSETLRDLGHVEASVAAIFSVAEIARVQGFDLYTAAKARMAVFLEFQAGLRQFINPMPASYIVKSLNFAPTYETGYNRLSNVLGMSLPRTKRIIYPAIRSAQPWATEPAPSYINAVNDEGKHWLGGQGTYSGGFESLTHGELGDGVRDGMLRAVCSGTPSNKSAYQVADVYKQNTTHTASFWLKGAGTVKLLVKAGNWGATLAQVTANATSTWTKVSVPNFNSGTNTQLTFQLAEVSNTAGTLDVDNCFLGDTSGTAPDILANSGFQGDTDYWPGSSSAPWSVVTAAPAIPANGLVGYYRLEQTTTDSSGSGNNGTAQAGFSYSSDAAEDSYSGQFDGSGGRVVVPDSASLRITGNLTVAAWVKANSYGNSPNLMAKSYNDGYRLCAYTSGGTGYLKLVLGNGSSTALFYGNQPLPVGAWTHVAAVVSISGSTAAVTFYINGVAGNIAYNTLSAIEAGTGPLVLGARGEGSYQPDALNGKLDQVTIYNRALSAAEILQLAQ